MMKFLLKIVFFVSLTLGSVSAQSDATPASPFDYTQTISLKLNELLSLAPDEFLVQVDEYRNSLEQYFEHKKRVCNGEFSTVILSEAGERTEDAHRLSKDERLLCFREMKALKTTYLNNMYLARKRYLESLHTKRVEDLDSSRVKALKELNATFSRFGVKDE